MFERTALRISNKIRTSALVKLVGRKLSSEVKAFVLLIPLSGCLVSFALTGAPYAIIVTTGP